jgi:hypothetical protein
MPVPSPYATCITNRWPVTARCDAGNALSVNRAGLARGSRRTAIGPGPCRRCGRQSRRALHRGFARVAVRAGAGAPRRCWNSPARTGRLDVPRSALHHCGLASAGRKLKPLGGCPMRSTLDVHHEKDVYYLTSADVPAKRRDDGRLYEYSVPGAPPQVIADPSAITKVSRLEFLANVAVRAIHACTYWETSQSPHAASLWQEDGLSNALCGPTGAPHSTRCNAVGARRRRHRNGHKDRAQYLRGPCVRSPAREPRGIAPVSVRGVSLSGADASRNRRLLYRAHCLPGPSQPEQYRPQAALLIKPVARETAKLPALRLAVSWSEEKPQDQTQHR